MSIATELQRIIDAKADLKTSIEAKGVTVGAIPLDEYAAKVDLIEGGGGIPGDVITQLDDINGEVIGTTVYNKMDAIAASKLAINNAIDTTGILTIGGSDVLSEIADIIGTQIIEGTKDLIDGEVLTTGESTDLQHALSSLQNINVDICEAIVAKGVEPDYARLDSYPAAIAAISGGTPTPELITGSTIFNPSADWSCSLIMYPDSGNHFTKVNGSAIPDTTSVYLNMYMTGATQWYYDYYYISPVGILPVGVTITGIKVHARVSTANINQKQRVGIRMGGVDYYSTEHTHASGFDNFEYTWTNNPATSSPWLASQILDSNFLINISLLQPTYAAFNQCTRLYLEVLWEYNKLAQEIPATGVVVSQTAFDDGALQLGNQYVAIDNGDGTVSLPNCNLMFAKPMKMIDGTNGAVNASNTIITPTTFNYGTISLGEQLYTVGQVAGKSPVFGSYLPNSFSPPYAIDSYFEATDGSVYKSLANGNYSFPQLIPSLELINMQWQMVKSHANIYVCKTQHTTPAEPPMWNWNGQAYSVGDKMSWSGMDGMEYYECNTAYTSTGAFWDETANWDNITTSLTATAFDASKWVEVTNVSSPLAVGVPLARTVHEHCDYADALSYAGHSDWRLANIRELMELAYFSNIASKQTMFPDTMEISIVSSFFSSTPNHIHPTTQNLTTSLSITDNSYNPFMSNGYNDNWAYGIYVRNIV